MFPSSLGTFWARRTRLVSLIFYIICGICQYKGLFGIGLDMGYYVGGPGACFRPSMVKKNVGSEGIEIVFSRF